MTRMTGPDCVVMCNLINTYIPTYIHTYIHSLAVVVSPWEGVLNFIAGLPRGSSKILRNREYLWAFGQFRRGPKDFAGKKNKVWWAITARTQNRLWEFWVPMTIGLQIM